MQKDGHEAFGQHVADSLVGERGCVAFRVALHALTKRRTIVGQLVKPCESSCKTTTAASGRRRPKRLRSSSRTLKNRFVFSFCWPPAVRCEGTYEGTA